MTPLVNHISDTARWVAADRAAESRRADALFHDPYAAVFAGDIGRAIATSRPLVSHSNWWIVTRTLVLDQLILHRVAAGVDRVVNLAAGYDTRPHRLPLPRSLRWIEIDLPAVIQEKHAVLNQAPASCAVTRIPGDLGDNAQRPGLLDRAFGDAERVLVITEGLLVYLTNSAVVALSGDLHRDVVDSWIIDLPNNAMLHLMQASTRHILAHSPFRFGLPNSDGYFRALRWNVEQQTSLLPLAARLHRLPTALVPVGLIPQTVVTHRWWPSAHVMHLRP